MILFTEYPFWFIVICFILGLLYSLILYFKNKKYELSKAYIILLAVLRFVSVSMIAILLLSPLIKTVNNYTQKPILVFAQDNSSSVIKNKDSVFYKSEYLKNLKSVEAKLSGKYEIKNYSFGSKLTQSNVYSFNEKQTDFSMLFDELNTKYTNRNLGAVIIASDGIYNKGINPYYASRKLNVPVYTIALGDTIVHRDAVLYEVNYNKIAFLGNKFPLEVIIKAKKCKGLKAILSVVSNKKNIFSKEIIFTNDNFVKSIPISIKADKTGIQKYNVKLSYVTDETNISNNEKNIFIDVLKSNQKILFLANSPHPDISALKQTIKTNYNFEVDDYLIRDFNKSVDKYDLVIFHQLPSFYDKTENLIKELKNKKIPMLIILGKQTDINKFNLLKMGCTIAVDKKISKEIYPVLNNDFSLFSISKNLRKTINFFQPLNCVSGKYIVNNSGNILFYQKNESLLKKSPLIIFNDDSDVKTCIIFGEGIWRWRLADYFNNNNHNSVDELFNKIIRYLSLKKDKSFFRIISKNIYKENKQLEFEALVYNQSYELVNNPDVNFEISDEKGNKFPFVFSKTKKSYYLNAGSFVPGNYKYSAKVKQGDKVYIKKGEFIVSPVNVENLNTIANHNILYKISKSHDAEMLYPDQINSLPVILKNREDIKPIMYSQKRFFDVINLKIIFFILIALLSAEWFLRKRAGYY